MLMTNTDNLKNNTSMQSSMISLLIQLERIFIFPMCGRYQGKKATDGLKLVDRFHRPLSSDMLHLGKLRLRKSRVGFTLPD